MNAFLVRAYVQPIFAAVRAHRTLYTKTCAVFIAREEAFISTCVGFCSKHDVVVRTMYDSETNRYIDHQFKSYEKCNKEHFKVDELKIFGVNLDVIN